MTNPDLHQQSPGHYASVSGRGRVVRLSDGLHWQGIRPTGERSPIFDTLTAADAWLSPTNLPAPPTETP